MIAIRQQRLGIKPKQAIDRTGTVICKCDVPAITTAITDKEMDIDSARESVLIEMGYTRVICTATVDDHIPQFLKGSGRGWVTAEYGMLPRSSPSRIPRESVRRSK